jgi:hypothetical protein
MAPDASHTPSPLLALLLALACIGVGLALLAPGVLGV